MTRDDIIRMAREAGCPDPMVFLAAYERLTAAAAQDWERVCDQHLRHIDKLKARMKRAEALNQELLGALRYHQEQTRPIERTRAAIAKAEGQA
jgi:tRNA-dihydrouridine synthase